MSQTLDMKVLTLMQLRDGDVTIDQLCHAFKSTRVDIRTALQRLEKAGEVRATRAPGLVTTWAIAGDVTHQMLRTAQLAHIAERAKKLPTHDKSACPVTLNSATADVEGMAAGSLFGHQVASAVEAVINDCPDVDYLLDPFHELELHARNRIEDGRSTAIRMRELATSDGDAARAAWWGGYVEVLSKFRDVLLASVDSGDKCVGDATARWGMWSLTLQQAHASYATAATKVKHRVDPSFQKAPAKQPASDPADSTRSRIVDEVLKMPDGERINVSTLAKAAETSSNYARTVLASLERFGAVRLAVISPGQCAYVATNVTSVPDWLRRRATVAEMRNILDVMGVKVGGLFRIEDIAARLTRHKSDLQLNLVGQSTNHGGVWTRTS